MNMFLIVLGFVSGFAMLGCAAYLILRVKIPIWATEYWLFISPPFGRILARTRAGFIIGYYANLKGLGVHIDKKTGERLPGEERIWSLCWKIFGAYFIGLDSVHEYKIEITEIDVANKPVTTTRTAHSLHYSGSYNLLITSAESLEGTKLGLQLRFTLKTTHAGQCLKFKDNWIAVANSAIKAAARDFVGKRKVRLLLAMQN